MKIALLTDTHFGARNDSQVFNEYFMQFYDELFFPYLEEHNIKTVIHLGDIVDRRKYINFKTLENFRNNFVYRLGKMGVETHVILGNHDIYHKNTNSINAMHTLFTTLDGKYEPWIYTDPTVVNFDGLDILFIPWITPDNSEQSIQTIQDTKAQVAFGHLEVQGFLMAPGMQPSPHGLSASLFDKFDIACSGHYHHRSDNGTLFYLGSAYEITWADYQDDRGFHIFDTDTRELTFIKNPNHMFYKIFYDDKDKQLEDVIPANLSQYKNRMVKVVVTNKTNPYWFDIMLDHLYKSDPYDVTIVEDHSEYDVDDETVSVDQAEDTLTILGKFIDTMETNVQKEELKTLFGELYSEAMTVND